MPYKFDPLFVEDPLVPGNNVGRNCFRVLQILRCFRDVRGVMARALEGELRALAPLGGTSGGGGAGAGSTEGMLQLLVG